MGVVALRGRHVPSVFLCSVRLFLTLTLPQYYEKNDKMLPGKKGISLTVDQYQEMKDAIVSGAIDREIEKLKG